MSRDLCALRDTYASNHMSSYIVLTVFDSSDFSTYIVILTHGGRSCVIPGCFTHTGGKKYKGVSVFTIPTRKCDAEWGKKLCNVIGTYRTMDSHLKKLIADGKCYICEKHFKPEDIEFTSKFFGHLI